MWIPRKTVARTATLTIAAVSIAGFAVTADARPKQQNVRLQCVCSCGSPDLAGEDRVMSFPWSGDRASCQAMSGSQCEFQTSSGATRSSSLYGCDSAVAGRRGTEGVSAPGGGLLSR